MITVRKMLVTMIVAVMFAAPGFSDLVAPAVQDLVVSKAQHSQTINYTCPENIKLEILIEDHTSQNINAGTPLSEPLHIMTGEQKSVTMCLYALLGVGLCTSMGHLKKMSNCLMPEWYHADGPAQIGHTHALNPDFMTTSTLLVALDQPDTETNRDKFIPESFAGDITSLWRTSQFIPEVQASRGPPSVL